jgi:uncharacterized Zn finger protein
MQWYSFRPYVSVARRQAKAAKLTARLQRQGRTITPVKIEGKTIAQTFWGKAWCDHLESYSDYANRLPRGRTYVRNGSVIDLQISRGKITAMVSGSEVYDVTIKIEKLHSQRWKSVRSHCAGQVGSLLELLQGRFDKSVMAVLTDRDKGLFPAPAEISLKCSCPDWAGMCKHVAAVLYGVGSRFDHQPELLFVLRQVDHLDLLDQMAAAGSLASTAVGGEKTLKDSDLADVFGIDLEPAPATASSAAVRAAKESKRATRSVRRPAKTAGGGGAPAMKVTRTRSSKEKPNGRTKDVAVASGPGILGAKSRKAVAKLKSGSRARQS